LAGFSDGFLVANDLSDDNDPHIKVVELFTPETMTVLIWLLEIVLHLVCWRKRLLIGSFRFRVPPTWLRSKNTPLTLTAIGF